MRLILAVAIAATALWADVRPAAHVERNSAARLDAFFSDLHDRGLFDGAVVISDATGSIFEKGFGFANAERHVVFTPDTPADGASLAKTFTAALLLSMQHDGMLDLDKPARLLLPDLPYPEVTLRHLLSHTSGIPVEGYEFFDAYLPADQVRTTEMFLRVLADRKPAMKSPPGTSFEYSSFGYDLAALAAAHAGGKPYFKLLQDRFFVPFGITSAFARPGRLHEFPGIRTLAYRRGSGTAPLNDVFDFEGFHGGSNIYLSARDLDRWNRSFLKGAPRSPGGPEALELAKVGTAASGLTLGSWYRTQRGTAFWYSGHLQGFHSEVFRDVTSRQSIVYMSNNTIEPWLQKGIVRSVRAILAGGTAPPLTAPAVDEVPVTGPSSLSGTWRVGDHTLVIQSSSGHMHLSKDGVRYPVFPEGRQFFYVPGLDYIIGFGKAKDGGSGRLYLSTAVDERFGNAAHR